ncbi:Uncharacterized protein Cus16_3127 [Curtobacterium sp. ER1/6]|nr:Uncharacterized protein Cus16_3127 [Curtobacterium sp. ER1/6]
MRRGVLGCRLRDRTCRDGGVRELDGPADDRVEHVVVEGLDDALHDLAGVQGPRVVHGREDAVEPQGGVQAVAHLVDRLDEERDAAQGEELALERDEDAVRRGERVDGEQAERRLAVDEDEVVVVRHLAEHAREDLLASDLVDEVDFGSGQVDVRGNDVEHRHVRRLDDLARVLHGAHEQVVDRGDVVRADAEAGGQGALRVEVDGEDLAAVLGQRGAEVDRRRGLADAALLVAERDDASRTVAVEFLGHGELPHGPTGGADRGLAGAGGARRVRPHPVIVPACPARPGPHRRGAASPDRRTTGPQPDRRTRVVPPVRARTGVTLAAAPPACCPPGRRSRGRPSSAAAAGRPGPARPPGRVRGAAPTRRSVRRPRNGRGGRRATARRGRPPVRRRRSRRTPAPPPGPRSRASRAGPARSPTPRAGAGRTRSVPSGRGRRAASPRSPRPSPRGVRPPAPVARSRPRSASPPPR